MITLGYLDAFVLLMYCPKEEKFDPRARKTILLGYMDTQKGYKLFDMDSGTFLVSRDVIFHETIFPYKGAKEEIGNIFCEQQFFPNNITTRVPLEHDCDVISPHDGASDVEDLSPPVNGSNEPLTDGSNKVDNVSNAIEEP